MGTVTGVMHEFVEPKNKAMSQSHSPIQFVLFNLHFGFWGTYNPYPHELGKKLQHLFKENIKSAAIYYNNSLLETVFFLSVVIMKEVLY